ncbi:MAG: hypothetical protein C4547_02440 [Phycisphaerales bacterium]|nr:MAG: hypothetical protein C4547_02440 [Phycisphaerales bacterium]
MPNLVRRAACVSAVKPDRPRGLKPAARCFVALAVVFVALAVCDAMPANVHAQGARVFDPPDPANFFQNTTFAIDGRIGYVPTFGRDMLWSFDVLTGRIIDPDGLVLPGVNASDPFLTAGERLVIPGWFPNQAVLVADISNPADLKVAGVIPVVGQVNIQGQNIEMSAGGIIGFVASFPNDTLYSFNVDTMSLEDPDGLALPGNPDRIALAGDRLALVDTTNGRIMVADVSNPANLTLAGVITLPGGNSFGSNDNIVFAADGRTGFVSNQQRAIHSFDVVSLSVVDPDGLPFGTQGFGDHVALHGDTLAAIYSRGLTFVDVSDPADMHIISEAQFGGTVAPQGDARVAFSRDGTRAAMPVIFPAMRVYVFDVATGAQAANPFPVDDQPNFLTVFQPGDRVGVACSGIDADNVYLIHNLVSKTGDGDDDGDVDLVDVSGFQDCYSGSGGGVGPQCEPFDLDGDKDIDLRDWAALATNMTGAL